MQLLFNFIRRYWLVIAAINLTLITVLSLTPLAELPTVPGTDKTHHFIAYGALIFSVALRRPKRWLWIALFFFCWSGVIELLQPYVNRYGEWLDLLANGTGLMCGIALAFIVEKLFLTK
ncbi:VanZ family protein [Photobacterium swingsii]|uniref:VanZ family protein n=1 Tax=Photobacterium swingsii TaxID=680026 RepID=UPI003D0FFF07